MKKLLLRNYVNGEWVTTGRTFPNPKPIGASHVRDMSEADRAVGDLAVRSARAAMDGAWGRMSAAERSEILHKVADGIEARFDEFLEAEVADAGHAYPHARAIDIPRGAANFRIFADLVKAWPNEACEMAAQDGGQVLNYSHWRPLGVVAGIAPWDLPLLLLSWKVAPAMAAGNAVIAKPSEETPATATLLAEVMAEAGVPPGAFNLVHGVGPDCEVEVLSACGDLDGLAFVGEHHVGTIAMKAAQGVKPELLAQGGRNPARAWQQSRVPGESAGRAFSGRSDRRS